LDDAAANAQVALRADEPDAPLMVKADPDRIKQLLINLVDNAIKYNHPGGSVHIQAERQADDMVRIAVQDTGDGIAAEHLERVFERFYRIDKSRSRELGGTGLGLSIVKHIAQLYSGYAKANSKPGVGSVFEVFLKI
jgi:two-component system phosphate regulon sensor histidine kinase PhoR